MPWVIELGLLMGAVDVPGGRRDQASPTTRLGGVAIALGLIIGIGLTGWALHGPGRFALRQAWAIGLGAAIVFAVGLLDDLVEISVFGKLAAQILAAFLLVQTGIRFQLVGIPFLGEVELGVLASVVSILWIIGVTNAINLIDGLDGVAAGVALIVSAGFFVYAMANGQLLSMLICAAMVGACAGFLPANWHPARAFMGDSGSLTLGFVLASVSIHSSLKTPTLIAIVVPLLLLGVPVFDTLAVMVRRFARSPSSAPVKRALRVFHADREHLHHLMLFFGGTRRRVALSIYALVLASSIFALTVALTQSALLGSALVVLEALVVLAVRRIGMALRQRGVAAAPNLSAAEEVQRAA